MDLTFEDFAGSGAAMAATDRSAYDSHYLQGGFGYEDNRERHACWAKRNYIQAFGLAPGRLLDVGCGDGFWASVFAGEGFTVAGFDTSAGGIEVARARYPGVDFVVASADTELPYRDGAFDVVFCRSLTHMCRADLDGAARVFASLRRLLAPGGMLLTSWFSRRDGSVSGSTTMHRVSAMVATVEAAGYDPAQVMVVNDYAQIVGR